MLIRFTSERGYEAMACNPEALFLFNLPEMPIPENPLRWEQLPVELATYLNQVFPNVTGEPEELLPNLNHPSKEKTQLFAKLFYEMVPATETSSEQHWYLFFFESTTQLIDSAENKVNQHKLETVGELASGVAHDFNNLIMGIQSNIEAMLVNPHLNAEDRNIMANIIRACSTGSSLTRALLGYAKRQPLTMTQFNLGDLVRDVTRIASLPSGRHYTLKLSKELQDESEKIPVVGCFSSLSHCLLNLIKNGSEAMPEGGTIQVLWEGSPNMAKLTVRDQGGGIPQQDLQHIFEPFYSTKKKGTGLGLAMVKGIMEQHSGTVQIRSTVNAGTSVSLIWPRTGPAKPEGSVPLKVAKDQRPSTRRIISQTQRIFLESKQISAYSHFKILVIDDDDLVREGLVALLNHLGHETISHRNPVQALEELIASTHPPDLVIIDYNMPELNGTDFITKYMETTATAPQHATVRLLLMSGLPPSHFQAFMEQSRNREVGILEKPFSLETLRQKLGDVHSQRKLTKHLMMPNLSKVHPLGRPNSGKFPEPNHTKSSPESHP